MAALCSTTDQSIESDSSFSSDDANDWCSDSDPDYYFIGESDTDKDSYLDVFDEAAASANRAVTLRNYTSDSLPPRAKRSKTVGRPPRQRSRGGGRPCRVTPQPSPQSNASATVSPLPSVSSSPASATVSPLPSVSSSPTSSSSPPPPPPPSWPDDPTVAPIQFPFSGNAGLKIDTPVPLTPLTVFNKFLTSDLLMLTKKETNLYQRQMKQTQTSVKANGIHCRWKPVTIAELQAFLSLSLYMGVVKKPSLAHYWSRSLPYKEYFAPSVMSRDRYAAILAMLHFNDNGNYIPVGDDGHDKLLKFDLCWTNYAKVRNIVLSCPEAKLG